MIVQKILTADQGNGFQSVVDFDQDGKYPCVLLICIEGAEAIPIIEFRGDMNKMEEFNGYPIFSEILKYNRIASFEDALFLTTIFQIDPWFLLDKEREPEMGGAGDIVLREILMETRGLLLYSHQLEQVYSMLTGASVSEAAKFRRDWNLKKPWSRKVAAGIGFAEGFTLLDFLVVSTLKESHFVYSANFKGAFQLYKYLKLK